MLIIIAHPMFNQYTQGGIDFMEEAGVATNAKDFAEKLNKCLDESEAPALVRERAGILSKLLDIPRQQAWSILEGHIVPEHTLLQRIAVEFEVDLKWLCGNK